MEAAVGSIPSILMSSESVMSSLDHQHQLPVGLPGRAVGEF